MQRKIVHKTGLFIIAYLFMMAGIFSVLAAPNGVASNPALFSLIVTDTSRNANVIVHDNHLSFSPGRGLDGEMYGFQPGSKYYYEDLFRIVNLTGNEIVVWHTLNGDMERLYDAGAFWLDLEGSSAGRWNRFEGSIAAVEGVAQLNQPSSLIRLEGSEQSGGIHFYFSIPSGQAMGSYSGHIMIHALGEDDWPGGLINEEIEVTEIQPEGEEKSPVALLITGVDNGLLAVSNPDVFIARPEQPQVSPGQGLDSVKSYSLWPPSYLWLFLLLPLLFVLISLFQRRVLVLLPGTDGRYKVIARKIARRKGKKWVVDIEGQINKFTARHSVIVVDFRGGSLKGARKVVYFGRKALGEGLQRYALVSGRHMVTWGDELQARASRTAV